ncbi:J domain-containing protein [Antarcticirhabdus aurantiaca]|uniref:DnaJ family molecular chaperone n=1 Tax=Antarcticirhabdus aurantiaca TaxID=2606717 RepID=A0ACD4NID8_9HYPH|nr:DnaJ family molecular chaperone [Antarcticirhabdus aurantiaca]WAJ26549.1 DnaJ family molecular chaperone [Jeongeuplla avenae]
MDILRELSQLVRAIPTNARTALDAIVEGVRTLFEGDRETRRRVAFGVAIIALSAKMAKADGVVTEPEVAAFRQILAVPPEEWQNVLRLYNIAKQDIAGFEAYAGKIAALCDCDSGDCALLVDVLDGLFHIAKADGVIHGREIGFLQRIAEVFGLSEAEFATVRDRHVATKNSPHMVLGVPPGAPREAVRARYLELVRENHPDRLVARGVPDEFLFIANERMKAINAAYHAMSRTAVA